MTTQTDETSTTRPDRQPPCCADGSGTSAGPDNPVIALVGAPNVGKSTLFNTLTGARRTVGNWPGTTVEVGSGIWPTRHGLSRAATVLDLPGAYSLDPLSPDEALTRALLLDAPAAGRPDLVVVTADAAHLARSLHIVAQLREHPYRVVVALTMSDVARRRGITHDIPTLAEALGCPVISVDPRQRQGQHDLAAAVETALAAAVPAPRTVNLPDRDDHPVDPLDRDDERFTWITTAVTRATQHDGADRQSHSDRIDAVVTHPVAGPIIFLVTMWVVFQITTTVAKPLQDALGSFFSGPVSDGARALLTFAGLQDTPVKGLVIDGLIAGVGMLLTFVPLMALMFLLLALLEDSGYMARAAVVTDRLMRRLGLPGRAFLPLVVGFGCNVPAISATRILGQARQRLLVALLVPFTSCSARLTVYVMLAGIFFPDHAGNVVFAMYLLSILLVVLTGLALRATLWRTMGSEPLILDLPPYQRPTARLSLAVTWTRLRGFLHTAGGIIVATVVVVWALQSTPVHSGSFGDVPTQDSAYGVAAHTIAPVFAPAGFGQWQTASALVVGFVAKEAVISSWAQTYAVDDPEDSGAEALAGHIQQAFDQSSGGHPLPAVLAFLVFLLAYTPCVATLAAQRREIGARWTLFGVGVQLVVAWTLAVVIFQIGRFF
ncbi:Fe(2+) transporter FeoB [Austwickia sp. TVS 96-490-7B]|uniref:ferrous iron transport protein B n=1 Tax=Austwickia sp. TVS 96-490-7B TaxID=2830843 RepID=UPI001C590803|nr:ferrous iron transport protein B [Austwickia sp. TVS 96-490-7B]MBW3086266.1 Fe(2+) transporter FeoB [Austwickia sp. TVS 96-490-7B]